MICLMCHIKSSLNSLAEHHSKLWNWLLLLERSTCSHLTAATEYCTEIMASIINAKNKVWDKKQQQQWVCSVWISYTVYFFRIKKKKWIRMNEVKASLPCVCVCQFNRVCVCVSLTIPLVSKWCVTLCHCDWWRLGQAWSVCEAWLQATANDV